MLQFSISLYQIDFKNVILQYINLVGYILFENCRSLGSFSKGLVSILSFSDLLTFDLNLTFDRINF